MNERKKGKKIPAKTMITAIIVIVVAATSVHFAYFGQKNADTGNNNTQQTPTPKNPPPQAQTQTQPQNNQPTAPSGAQNQVLDQNQDATQALGQNSFDWHNEREIQDNENSGSGTSGTQPPAGTANQPKKINEECYQNCLEGKTEQECTAICEEII